MRSGVAAARRAGGRGRRRRPSDARDREREHGALRVADDAFEVDTTGRTVDDVIAGVVELARERRIA